MAFVVTASASANPMDGSSTKCGVRKCSGERRLSDRSLCTMADSSRSCWRVGDCGMLFTGSLMPLESGVTPGMGDGEEP